jgi:hypothetical protein
MDCRNVVDRISEVGEEEATTTLLEQDGERKGLRTWVNMFRSRTVGGESSAPEVLCEFLVFRARTTKR